MEFLLFMVHLAISFEIHAGKTLEHAQRCPEEQA